MLPQWFSRTVRVAVAAASLTLVLPIFAGDPPVDSAALLLQIRNKVAERLSQLPNYTCSEVIDRFVRRPSGGLQRLDRVELEVAFVGNHELFAKPGGEFQEGHASRLVSDGTISDGEFASHMVSLFRTNHAEFEYAGEGKKDGHKTYRFNFGMPQEKSNFLLKHDSAQGIVGYKGSFWVDTQTLDLVRMEIKAEDIPAHIGIESVSETMKYGIVHTSSSEFLLPEQFDLGVSYGGGLYSSNMVKLQNCREYTGESKVAFGAEAPSNGSASRSAEDPAKQDAANPEPPKPAEPEDK